MSSPEIFVAFDPVNALGRAYVENARLITDQVTQWLRHGVSSVEAGNMDQAGLTGVDRETMAKSLEQKLSEMEATLGGCTQRASGDAAACVARNAGRMGAVGA